MAYWGNEHQFSMFVQPVSSNEKKEKWSFAEGIFEIKAIQIELRMQNIHHSSRGCSDFATKKVCTMRRLAHVWITCSDITVRMSCTNINIYSLKTAICRTIFFIVKGTYHERTELSRFCFPKKLIFSVPSIISMSIFPSLSFCLNDQFWRRIPQFWKKSGASW